MSQQPLTPALIRLIEDLNRTETLDLEFKSARGGLPTTIWSTISAFANTFGGRIVLGVGENGGQITVDGVPNAPELVQRLTNDCHNPQKIDPAPIGATDISIIPVDDKKVVVVRVPPAPRRSRPVFINGNPYRGTYIRRNEGDYLCQRQDVDRMMREASSLAPDAVILDNYSWDDIDGETFAHYRRRFQTQNPTHMNNRLSNEDFLRAIGGYRVDRESGRQGITVAGLMMFGTEEAIRSYRPSHQIDFRIRSGGSAGSLSERWQDRLIFEGSLFEAYFAIYPRLTSDVAIPFRLVDGVRSDTSPRHEVFREALVNLLVHADYREPTKSLIERTDEECIFFNPGSSRMIDLNAEVSDPTDARNPALVRMFRFVGLSDDSGSGVRRIQAIWRELGHEPPEFLPGNDEQYSFRLRLSNADMLSSGDRAWLRNFGPDWTEAEQLALIVARDSGSIDNATLRRLTGLHPTDVTQVLGRLRDRGLLQLVGWGRGAQYHLDPSVTALTKSSEHEVAISPVVTDTAILGRNAAGLGPNDVALGRNAAGLGPNDVSLGHSDASIAESALRDGGLIDDPIWPTLQAIANPVATTSRAHPADLQEVIMTLCQIRPLSIRELMWLLQRDRRYLSRITKTMVAGKSLAYLYPDQPRNPHQRYRAITGIPTETVPGQQALPLPVSEPPRKRRRKTT